MDEGRRKRKVRVVVRLTTEDRAVLRQVAATTGWSQSETIRRAIRALRRELGLSA